MVHGDLIDAERMGVLELRERREGVACVEHDREVMVRGEFEVALIVRMRRFVMEITEIALEGRDSPPR